MIISFFCSAVLICQVPDNIQRNRDDNKGNYVNRKQGILEGNRINTLFYNDGEIGKWEFTPSCEWPAGKGHNYLDGYTFMVSSEVTAPGGAQTIHPLETAYRAKYSMDPVTQVPWGFEPISGYSNESSSFAIATNNQPSSWPDQWPAALNLSDDYNGHWYGYFGKDSMKATQEVYFVMDDSQDKKFTRNPYNYFPISSDSSRGGLGLRAEVREFQWYDSLRKDIIFIKYNVWNISDYDYDKTVFGIFCEPGIGSNSTEPPVHAGIDSIRGLIYAWAPSGLGSPGNWNSGYFGMGILSSDSGYSTSMAVTSINDISSSSAWPSNNDAMWKKMTGGIDTSSQSQYSNVIVGRGPFTFKKWTNKEFSTSIIMGTDLNDILNKKLIAQTIYNNNLELPDSIMSAVKKDDVLLNGYNLKQNYPNPFNPITTIDYSISRACFVTIKVYDVLGKEVAALVNEAKKAGSYHIIFDAGKLASGIYFYRMAAEKFSAAKKLIVLK
jgi:hypothetical protein